MSTPFLQIIPIRLYCLAIGMVFFFTINRVAANNGSAFKNEADSIKLLLKNCNTDSCKIKVLSKCFWKYYERDYQQAKYYGEWIIEEFKNKPFAIWYKNFIKGYILQNEDKLDSALVYYKKALPVSDNAGKCICYQKLAELNIELGFPDSAIRYMKLNAGLLLKD